MPRRAITDDPLPDPAPSPSAADAPVQAAPSGSEGIATVGPLAPVTATGYPVSERTAEPRRPVVAGAASASFYASAAWTGASVVLALVRATNVSLFHEATRIWAWTRPDPVSWAAVLVVLLVALVAVVVAGAAASAGFNAWNGHPWIRWIGLGAAAASAGTLLLNPVAAWAIVPAVLGAGLVWLPGMTRYVQAWRAVRQGSDTGPGPRGRVVYGPRRRGTATPGM